MAYYPKSQIKSNLYTNGNELILSTTQQPYKGYYYKTSTGQKYTGKSPQDGPNILLTFNQDPYSISEKLNEITLNDDHFPSFLDLNVKQISNLDIYSSNTTFFNKRLLPSPIQTIPTQQDKDLGLFSRYFCKKNNENLYIEIDKDQFTQLQNKDTKIAWDLYTPKQVLWQIKGDKTQTYNANKNNISLIEQRDKWYGFTQYFKDRFLKYYLES